MKARALLAMLAVVLIGVAAWISANRIVCGGGVVGCERFSTWGQFFDTSIRASLFSGFLTLGGFLLSLKTFIIVNMKKEVYEKKEYGEIFDAAAKRGASGSRYGPLEDLGDVIFFAIVSCITTACLQMTIGLFAKAWSSAICLAAALYSIVMLLFVLRLIRLNLKTMFEFLDTTAHR